MKIFRLAYKFTAVMATGMLLYGCNGKPRQLADSVVTGKIWTGDPEHP